MGSKERELNMGTCFSDMIISEDNEESGSSSSTQKPACTRAFIYTFKRNTAEHDLHCQDSLLNKKITVGDLVLMSDDDGARVALASGKVAGLSAESVDITTDTCLTTPRNKDTVFRIDKDLTTFGKKSALTNLIQLFAPVRQDTEDDKTTEQQRQRQAQTEQHRRMIVDLKPPSFALPDEVAPKLQQFVASTGMNLGQQRAVKSVLSAKNYALILGMPGTGKTTTITKIVKLLVDCGKSILLTSYTHSAVDNILLKVKEDGVDFLRVGQLDRVHPDLHGQQIDQCMTDITTTSQLAEFYKKHQVVATTCLGIKHALFSHRQFDYCIIDEASQITQPVCLGPIACANAFILVGDHYQLPPLVQSPEAREQGMDVSLFKRLSTAHPEAIVELEEQYRMNASVMCLANDMIYGQRLKCGTARVARSKLELPRLHAASQREEHPCWLQHTLDPDNSVVFLDTEQVPAPEVKNGKVIRNDTEAEIVKQLVCALTHAGLPQRSVGVVSPYRMQLQASQLACTVPSLALLLPPPHPLSLSLSCFSLFLSFALSLSLSLSLSRALRCLDGGVHVRFCTHTHTHTVGR